MSGTRSILAVAALTAGVSWWAPGPAGASTCEQGQQAPDSVAAVCEEITGARASGRYGPMKAPPGGAASAVERLAMKLGLPGMSKAAAVLSVADMGGVAAGAGLPTLPMAAPGVAGLKDVSRLAESPDLPGLPVVPSEIRDLVKVPDVPGVVDRAVPEVPVLDLPRRAGEVEKSAPRAPDLTGSSLPGAGAIAELGRVLGDLGLG